VLHAIFPDCLEKAQTQILSLLSIFFLNFSQFKYFFGVLGSFLILNLKDIEAKDDDNADKKSRLPKSQSPKSRSPKSQLSVSKSPGREIAFPIDIQYLFSLKN
jgi:hypothetical protein